MIVVVAVFGRELLRLELAFPDGDSDDDGPEQTISSRHGGDFSFGFSPARPYWSSDPDEAPAVV